MKVAPNVQLPTPQLVARYRSAMRDVIASWHDVEAAGVPVLITSWYRPAAYNASVGGVQGSQHTLGTAVDAVAERGGVDLLAIAQRAAARHGCKAIASNRGAVHIQGLTNAQQRSAIEPASAQLAHLAQLGFDPTNLYRSPIPLLPPIRF